jgi:cell division protease FtsH
METLSNPWVVAGIIVVALVLIGRLNTRRELHVMRDRAAANGFAGVAGCDEAVADLREVVSFLKNPQRFEKLGATVPRGALLVGPPGTGKTLLARSVAAEAGVPFLSANGSDFVEMYVGVGAKRIRELYKEAREHKQAIVFIDEIDAVARARSGGGGGTGNPGSLVEHENTLIALLTELDGFKMSGIITIAATNRADVLDPALTRPGRLDRRIEVPNPDKLGRIAILGVHVSDKPLDADVDLDLVAERTPGLSGAELSRVCNEAALEAARQERKNLNQDCFDAAVELVALGRPRTSMVVTPRDRRITAWHEAGHAVCGLLLENAQDPVAVSIIPRGAAGGVTWFSGSEDQFVTREQAFEQLVVMMGGRTAEEIHLGGSCTQGASQDLLTATRLASEMVNRYGMSTRGLQVRMEGDEAALEAVDVILVEAHRVATELLHENIGLLERVAASLLEKDKLGRDELHELSKRSRIGVSERYKELSRQPAAVVVPRTERVLKRKRVTLRKRVLRKSGMRVKLLSKFRRRVKL